MRYYKIIFLCLIVGFSFLDAKKKKSKKKKNKVQNQIEEECKNYHTWQQDYFINENFRRSIYCY